MDAFDNFLHEVCDQFDNKVILGDFNLKCDGGFSTLSERERFGLFCTSMGNFCDKFLGKINSKESSLARKGRHSLEVPRSSRNWMAELTATTSLLVPTVVYC